MRIYPLDILAGTLLFFGILQMIMAWMIRRQVSRLKVVLMATMGFILSLLSSGFIYFSIVKMTVPMMIIISAWFFWVLLEFVFIFVWRCRRR